MLAQVKSVRDKTQHRIHSRQTSPQCQRGKEVQFFEPATVPVLWKCTFNGGALLSFLICTDEAQTKLISPCVCVSEWVAIPARKLWACECGQATVYPLSVCCQLSDWKLLFQISKQKALSQMFALCRYTAFPLEWSIASSAKTKRESMKNTIKGLLTHVSRTTSRGVKKEWNPEQGGGRWQHWGWGVKGKKDCYCK